MGFEENEVFKYLERWRDDEHYSNLNLMLDKGYIELAAKLLVDSKAINSKVCNEYAKSIESYIERMVKRYSSLAFKKDMTECMRNVEIWVNDANRYYFIDKSICFVTDSELIKWGFKKESAYINS